MEQREEFLRLWLSGRYTKSALCQRFGISRPTGDKWIQRHAELGLAGLAERSRAPRTHPNATPPAICEALVAQKRRCLSWGPKKLLDRLRREQPEVAWPADSTGAAILARAGLVKPRRRRRQAVPGDEAPFSACDAPNAVWSVDFKGDYRLGDGRRCYPLTLSDNYSRFLLLCQALPSTSRAAVMPWFERAFREFGLPWAIRSDNGAPFASIAVGGLSALSKWWIDLGIRPERIAPGRPSQNGRHERMHRSLKAWLGTTQGANLAAEQQRLQLFATEYNYHRSHEALGRQVPASRHVPSQRSYPARIAPAEYDEVVTVRRVRDNGEIKWRGKLIYLSEVLARDWVGMEPVAEGVWEVFYRFHPLGTLDERSNRIVPVKGWHSKRM
jgi:transposase InsO family protein